MSEMPQAQAPALTAEFLQAHLNNAHNHESFGRSIYAGILSRAMQQLKDGTPVDNEVVVQSEFRIKPDSAGCITVYSDVCQCYVRACGQMNRD